MTDLMKDLRKEYKAFGRTELMFDVYSDRINFVGFNQWVIDFFERRGILADFDRSGVSINESDMQKHGYAFQIGTYRVQCKDLRRKMFR